MRAIIALFGLASAFWALISFNVFVESADFEPVSKQIFSEEVFKDTALANLINAADAVPAFTVAFPAFARSHAAMSIRYLEDAIEKADPNAINMRMLSAKTYIQSSLSLSPSDSFLWLVLFWLENNQDGFRANNLKLLSFSYELAPREGWIAIRRNGRALAMLSQLQPVTQDETVAEFAGLVRSGSLTVAALNLVGPGWSSRVRLLKSLGDIDIRLREQLSRMLSREGFRVEIPGVIESEFRPWR